MEREIKFRGETLGGVFIIGDLVQSPSSMAIIPTESKDGRWIIVTPKSVGQYTGLKDKNGKDYYMGDIAIFDNGDTFVLKMEDWLEVYSDWIGEPECEDQVRDLYRICNATIIGNVHQDPDLLK